MLGGAIGDALGYPIEFKSYNEIKQQGFITTPFIPTNYTQLIWENGYFIGSYKIIKAFKKYK